MDRRHSKCSHHFILESPNGEWSLGKCGKCSKLDAFPNWMAKSAWMPKSEGTTESKREFLRSKGIKYWARYSIELKQEVIEAATRFGIHAAARQFDIPISTVGLWAKGHSVHNKNSEKYTDSFKLSAIQYYQREGNFKKTAKKLGVPRSTLQSWSRKHLREGKLITHQNQET